MTFFGRSTLLTTVLLALISGAAGEDLAADAEPAGKSPAQLLAFLPEVLATYDPDAKFTKQELLAELAPGMQELAARWTKAGKEEMTQELRRTAELLVKRTFLLDLAAKDGFKPSDEQAKKKLGELIDRYGEGRFDGMLRQRGVSRELFLRDLGRQETINGWAEAKVAAEIEIDPADAAAEYESNKQSFTKPESARASHILLTVKPEAEATVKEEAKKKLTNLRARILQGEDFAALAKEHSSCPSAARGGDLGSFGRGRMVPAFDKAVFAMKVGQVSEIVESPFGYHLIKLVELQEGGLQPLDEDLKARIVTFLRSRRAGTVIEEKLAAQVKERNLKLLF